MNEIIKAKPTRYRGITFRSKMEARFAVALDNTPLVYEWSYESKYNECDWLPDFTIWIGGFDIVIAAELKPIRPNMNYITWFANEGHKLFKSDGVVKIPVLFIREGFEALHLMGLYLKGHKELSLYLYTLANFKEAFQDNWKNSEHFRFDLYREVGE